MVVQNLGESTTPSDDYLRAHITQPVEDADNYEIKPDFLTLV
jgi:hypothetical protein